MRTITSYLSFGCAKHILGVVTDKARLFQIWNPGAAYYLLGRNTDGALQMTDIAKSDAINLALALKIPGDRLDAALKEMAEKESLQKKAIAFRNEKLAEQMRRQEAEEFQRQLDANRATAEYARAAEYAAARRALRGDIDPDPPYERPRRQRKPKIQEAPRDLKRKISFDD
jgi:hypothetical protein